MWNAKLWVNGEWMFEFHAGTRSDLKTWLNLYGFNRLDTDITRIEIWCSETK